MPNSLWKIEQGPQYEVPGLIEFLVKEGILVDNSWHNDACPRFDLAKIVEKDGDDYGVTLWVDHPYVKYRNVDKRFLASEGFMMSESDEEVETDDLREALLFVFKRLAKYFPKYRGYSGGQLEELLDSLAEDYHNSISR